MKHLKNSMKQISTMGAPPYVHGGRDIPHSLRFLFCLLLLGTLPMWAQAQDCTLVCNGTPEAPNEASLGTDCMYRFELDHILEGPAGCPGDKLITVRDLNNELIAQGTNTVEFAGDELLGQVVSMTVMDIATQDFCVGYIRLSDSRPPILTNCGPVTASCVMETAPENLIRPMAADNCVGNIDLTYTDEVQQGTCLEGNIFVIDRTWTATDASGNSTDCVQRITVERPDLDEVVFPPAVDLSCVDADISADNTGRPQLGGIDIRNNGPCQLEVSMRDEVVPLCGMIERQILRTWIVSDPCTGFSREVTQAINIKDDEAPEITCPEDLTVRTDPNKCTATVNLPTATAIDNCSAQVTIEINTSYGAVGAGPHPSVPGGIHIVKYIATDTCGNKSQCTMQLTVADLDEPTAVCNDFLIISAASGGIAAVKAISFDEGSTDNCADQLYYKARRMNIGGCDGLNGDDSPQTDGVQEWFDDDVLFCCGEISNSTIQVILRVYEVDPGPGPVDPSREEKGGDLYGHYSECMVQAKVQDKLPPVFDLCPPDMTIDCSEDYSDLSIFGSPRVRDNCGFTLDSSAVFDLNDCGVGKILRSFTAIDDAKNVSTCLQMIKVENQNPLTEEQIKWPENYETDICGGATDPDDLPEGFDRPVVTDSLCGSISINYVDEVFSLAPPACYKILRRWTVLDWCSFDPDHPDTGGKYSRIQIIKVQDKKKPILNCPEPQTVSVGNDCVSGALSLPPITAEDCSPNVLITNDSPYANNGGANISGDYPLGTTVVKISASDKCGNVATCEVTIKVEDNKPPAPVCIVGISAPLFEMNGSPTAIVPASTFDGGSTDNCTPSEALMLSVR
ncbi:MAG: HYR domain-containing protein, partial [Lewinella sp.]|nr:HYR domain-containing protein [Lewinella sp.]